MKTLITLTILIFTSFLASVANSRNLEVRAAEISSAGLQLRQTRQFNKLIGSWLITAPSGNSTIAITDVVVNKIGKGIFEFSIIEDGIVLRTGLVGFVDRKRLYFAVPSLNGANLITFDLNKKFNRGKVALFRSEDRQCTTLGFNQNGDRLVECVGLPDQITTGDIGDVIKL